MKTKTLLVPSADIAHITSVRAGDVYKRVESSSYAEDDIAFGVITDVLNNGENTAITAIEFVGAFGSMTVKMKTFSGDRDLAIFPASPEEIEVCMVDAEESVQREVAAAERALDNVRSKLQKITEFRDGSLSKNLKRPHFVSQLPKEDEELVNA